MNHLYRRVLNINLIRSVYLLPAFLTWRLCCSFFFLFLFLWLCFTPCSVVYFAVWMCKSRWRSAVQHFSSCYSQRIKTWGKEKKKKKRAASCFVCSAVTSWFLMTCRTGLSAYHSYSPAPCPEDALCRTVIVIVRGTIWKHSNSWGNDTNSEVVIFFPELNKQAVLRGQ